MKRFALVACIAALALPAYAQDAGNATATFLNQAGEEVGTATLTQTPEGVAITGSVTGLTAGEHGFHVHETGNCDPSTEFESAGGHFEPGTHKHGLENPEGPHAGDIANQTAGDDGILTLDAVNPNISLAEGEANVFDDDGSALVIHAGPDDNKTDPSGNSGGRVACAVIEAASE